MPLKLRLDQAPDPEETIKLADLYSGSDEEGWTLATEDAGGLIVADAGIAGKIGEAREKATALEKRLKPFERLGSAPKDIAAALEELEALRAKGDPEQVAEERVSQLRQQIVAEFESERESLQSKVQSQSELLRRAALDRALDAMLDGDPETGVPGALASRRQLARKVLQDQLSVDEAEDGSYSVRVVDESGQPRLVPRSGDPMSPQQLWAEFSQSEQGSIFAQGSGNSGGPAAPTPPANGAPGVLPTNDQGQMLVPPERMNEFLADIGSGKAIVEST
jgi:hypothetical protein